MSTPPFNIVIVGQSGRLQYEAALFLVSLRATSPNFSGKIFVAEPEHTEKWTRNPKMNDVEVRDLIGALGGDIIQFENKLFGEYYPYGNKIECLQALPENEPFVFFDSDTLILDNINSVPFDFDRPSASKKVEGTWPEIELYGPGYTETWKSLYDQFGLDFESSLDLSQPDEYWRRYSYFNAGFFYYKCPKLFGDRFAEYAHEIKWNGPKEIECQTLDPWLDQVALPLVIHSFGGGRYALEDGYLDGSVSCHYRMLPLLYAKESDKAVKVLEEVTAPNKIKKVLKNYEPMKRMIYQGRGQKVRDLFDQNDLPGKERAIRNKIKSEGFWMR